MTNLFEKALLTGFGLFTLIIFFSIVNPFLGEISNYYKLIDNEKKVYMSFISKIDYAINSIIENPNETYIDEINYPKDLNVSFYENITKYEYFIQDQTNSVFKEYSSQFVENHYCDLLPDLYNLLIIYKSFMIDVRLN
ncbi:MAG: hypothetical protein ACFFA8_05500 [Promethearchaeota archaeon]